MRERIDATTIRTRPASSSIPKTIGPPTGWRYRRPVALPLTLTQQPLTRSFALFRQPVDLNWELDLFGRVRRNTEAARAEAQSVAGRF